MSTPPSEEQKEYWRRDLRLKRWSLITSTSGFAALAVGIGFSLKQAGNTTNALRNSVQQSMVTMTLNADRMFVDHPELRAALRDPAFKAGDPKYAAATEAAILLLDVFDIAASQTTTFRKLWSTPDAWKEWIVSEFKESPGLRAVYHQREKWYGLDLAGFVAEAEGRPPPKQKCPTY